MKLSMSAIVPSLAFPSMCTGAEQQWLMRKNDLLDDLDYTHNQAFQDFLYSIG